MYIPPNFEGREEELIGIIRGIARNLAKIYKFGYYDEEDIEQEALIIVIESGCLEKYDSSRPVENFVASHLRKRLYNFKRDRYIRPTPPCIKCPLKAFIKPDICTAYKDKMDCKFYKKWANNNTNKCNLMNAIHIARVKDEHEPNMREGQDFADNFADKEAELDFMDRLSFRARKFYIMIKHGCRVTSAQRKALQSEIADILGTDVELIKDGGKIPKIF